MAKKAVLVVIPDTVSGINDYEAHEIYKGDFLFERLKFDGNWSDYKDSIDYIAHDSSLHATSNTVSKTNILTKIENIQSHTDDTLVILSDHTPTSPATANIIINSSSTISASDLNAKLPNNPSGTHYVILIGGASGRFANALKDIASNMIILSSTNTSGEYPVRDEFNLGRGMENVTDIMDAFLKEKSLMPGTQHPIFFDKRA